jgi:hypothetical protein
MLAQFTHCVWSVVFEKDPDEQVAHRFGVGSLSLNTKEPGKHGCLVSQYGCPSVSWNLPEGHFVQVAALASFEKYISGHGLHARSVVAFGADSTCSPATHTVCSRQKPAPASGWKALEGHGSH